MGILGVTAPHVGRFAGAAAEGGDVSSERGHARDQLDRGRGLAPAQLPVGVDEVVGDRHARDHDAQPLEAGPHPTERLTVDALGEGRSADRGEVPVRHREARRCDRGGHGFRRVAAEGPREDPEPAGQRTFGGHSRTSLPDSTASAIAWMSVTAATPSRASGLGGRLSRIAAANASSCRSYASPSVSVGLMTCAFA